MLEKHEIEFYLIINEDCDFEVDRDVVDVRDKLLENAGGGAFRTIKLTAKVTLPVVEDAEIDIPDAAGATEQIKVEAD
jgi:hypothetical protein